MSSSSQGKDEDEEVAYILLEVTGIIDADSLSKTGNCRILGLMSENPILQVGNYVFSGEYKETIGTSLFFAEEPNLEETGPSLKYLCKSTKKLAMERAVLKPKKPSDVNEYSRTDYFYREDVIYDVAGTSGDSSTR